jgi:2'-5' RNA ligase
MHRLFVALRPPAPVRRLLLDVMGGVSGARWQNDNQLHLTLRFIGEVDRHRAEDVHAALGGVHHPAFEIAMSGLGLFEQRRETGVIWAGVTPHAPLQTLNRKVEQALARVGVDPDRRAFHPHVTLARLPRTAGSPGALIEQSGGLSSPPFPVADFRLFESRLTPEGPVYDTIERYPLSG